MAPSTLRHSAAPGTLESRERAQLGGRSRLVAAGASLPPGQSTRGSCECRLVAVRRSRDRADTGFCQKRLEARNPRPSEPNASSTSLPPQVDWAAISAAISNSPRRCDRPPHRFRAPFSAARVHAPPNPAIGPSYPTIERLPRQLVPEAVLGNSRGTGGAATSLGDEAHPHRQRVPDL